MEKKGFIMKAFFGFQVFSSWQLIANNGLTVIPPKDLPNSKEFLLNGYVKLLHWYFDDTPHNSKETVTKWSKKYIDNLVKISQINALDVRPTYGKESCKFF